MSGHSHWANVQRKKGSSDAKRGKLFSKLARQIMIAARLGGGDRDSNLTLKYAIDRAKAVSMPKGNIERAVKKGTGELEAEQLEARTYEAIGPGGVFILIDVLTDNRNRTASEIRKMLELKGAHLGSVAWAFERKGLLTVAVEGVSEDDLLDKVLEAGAEDLDRVGDAFQITTAAGDLDAVKRALADARVSVEAAELTLLPKSATPVDEEIGRRMLELLEQLQDHDDVQNVYSNIDLPEVLLAEMT